MLATNEIEPRRLLDNDENPFAIRRFDGFYKSICRRLENEAFFGRLIDPFHRAAIPEIWEDRVSFIEFEDSFFTYLEFAASLSRRPRVPGTVLGQLRGRPTSALDIKKALRKRIERGWEPNTWL